MAEYVPCDKIIYFFELPSKIVSIAFVVKICKEGYFSTSLLQISWSGESLPIYPDVNVSEERTLS